MKKLNDTLTINGKTLKNRICMPPMVCYGYSESGGLAGDKNVEHYRARAKGGAGLIIQEATCVSPEGKLAESQLGIWDDSQIEGHRRIVNAVHEEGGIIVVQIHHAGVVGIAKDAFCPSPYIWKKDGVEKTGIEMTIEDINRIKNDFISAAKRACAAGYDGVEIHGCHGYLLSQFLNRRVNARRDEYGTDEMKYAAEIYTGIREAVPADFIVGIRLGGFEPDLAAGIRHAKAMDALGVDFIDVSYGFYGELDIEKPEGFPFAPCVYAAQEIKKAVSCPVFAVNSINSPEQAAAVLEVCDVDMADIGRAMLVDPNWANKALSGVTPGKCLYCKVCQWRLDSSKCAGHLLLQEQ